MKKLINLLMAVVLLASMTACGNDDPKSNAEYYMLYRIILPSNVFDFANPTLSVYNPVTKTTELVELEASLDNRSKSDYNLDYSFVQTALASAETIISERNVFIYYYKVNGITKGMTYDATLSINPDQDKIDALDLDDKTTYCLPHLSCGFYDTTGGYAAIPNMLMSSFTGSISGEVERLSGEKYSETHISGDVITAN